jgi:hypothetical protein
VEALAAAADVDADHGGAGFHLVILIVFSIPPCPLLRLQEQRGTTCADGKYITPPRSVSGCDMASIPRRVGPF